MTAVVAVLLGTLLSFTVARTITRPLAAITGVKPKGVFVRVMDPPAEMKVTLVCEGSPSASWLRIAAW